MSFLSGLIADLIVRLLTFLEGLGVSWWKQHEAEVAVEDKAASDEKSLESAKDKQEKDDAAKNIIHDTFGSP